MICVPIWQGLHLLVGREWVETREQYNKIRENESRQFQELGTQSQHQFYINDFRQKQDGWWDKGPVYLNPQIMHSHNIPLGFTSVARLLLFIELCLHCSGIELSDSAGIEAKIPQIEEGEMPLEPVPIVRYTYPSQPEYLFQLTSGGWQIVTSRKNEMPNTLGESSKTGLADIIDMVNKKQWEGISAAWGNERPQPISPHKNDE